MKQQLDDENIRQLVAYLWNKRWKLIIYQLFGCEK